MTRISAKTHDCGLAGFLRWRGEAALSAPSRRYEEDCEGSRYLFGESVVEHKESIRFLVFSCGCLSRVSALALSQFAVLSFVSDSQLERAYAP